MYLNSLLAKLENAFISFINYHNFTHKFHDDANTIEVYNRKAFLGFHIQPCLYRRQSDPPSLLISYHCCLSYSFFLPPPRFLVQLPPLAVNPFLPFLIHLHFSPRKSQSNYAGARYLRQETHEEVA